MSNTLHIIGNGFDLAHGIESKYQHFKAFMLGANAPFEYHNAAGRLEEFYPSFDSIQDELKLWCDLETELPNIDFKAAFNYSTEDIEPEEDHEIRYIPTMEDAPETFLSPIFNTLYVAFTTWVNKIDLNVQPLKIPNFDSSGLFLNFNYTETLERLYGIPALRINYIHGRRNTTQELILGHCNDVDGDSHLSKNPEIYEYEGYRNIASVINNMRKNVSDIIYRNINYWPTLANIDLVVVYGHSLSEVDRPYFYKIKNSISSSAQWLFSAHYSNIVGKNQCQIRVDNIANYLGLKPNQYSIFKM